MTPRNVVTVILALVGSTSFFFHDTVAFSTPGPVSTRWQQQQSPHLEKKKKISLPSNSLLTPVHQQHKSRSRSIFLLRPSDKELGIASRFSKTNLDAVPLLPELWTSFVPPLLGLYKSEWGVSYGYGLAIAMSAASVWYRTAASPLNPIIVYQAAALVFFGLRLNTFILIRTRLSQRIQDFQKKIEERAVARGGRAKRLPYLLSVGLLYYGLVCPLILTSQLPKAALPAVSLNIMKILVGGQWLGYLTAALADLTKTYMKRKNKDERFLVTQGIFSLVRHPNYSGEIFAWTCNALCGSLAGAYLLSAVSPFSLSVIAKMATMALGWVGIVFVLLRSTTNLEKKQQEEYGDSTKYQEWVDSTWSGWTMPEVDSTSSAEEHHEIMMDTETQEASGSGI
jgi:protein-S-isoprenylcysteine O-methyltransferase Ste14